MTAAQKIVSPTALVAGSEIEWQQKVRDFDGVNLVILVISYQWKTWRRRSFGCGPATNRLVSGSPISSSASCESVTVHGSSSSTDRSRKTKPKGMPRSFLS